MCFEMQGEVVSPSQGGYSFLEAFGIVSPFSPCLLACLLVNEDLTELAGTQMQTPLVANSP